MSFATEILWFTDKQQRLSELQILYGMAQNEIERNTYAKEQRDLIMQIKKRLKGQVTLHMIKKISEQMQIKELDYYISL